MGMIFTIEDADLDKLYDVLKDINVRECPWFEVQDKHGNKAKYYRKPYVEESDNKLADILRRKTPEEQYDFMYWLLNAYGNQFSDTRQAVIDWLRKKENR